MIRETEARFIARCIQSARSCAVIGLSNMGKSTLLRDICSHEAREMLLQDKIDDYLFVYVDCNLMADRSEQAFHEATLRNVISALKRAGTQEALIGELNTLYSDVVQPSAPIRSPLAFDSAVRKVCEESERSLVIMFDEFDDPFAKLDGRVFLNLRAMKDEFNGTLSFVTATERPLFEIRSDNDSNEFAELFSVARGVGRLCQSGRCARNCLGDCGRHAHQQSRDEFHHQRSRRTCRADQGGYRDMVAHGRRHKQRHARRCA